MSSDSPSEHTSEYVWPQHLESAIAESRNGAVAHVVDLLAGRIDGDDNELWDLAVRIVNTVRRFPPQPPQQ